MTRKRKVFMSLLGVIFCTFIIHSYFKDTNKEEIEFPEVLYDIPTYNNSRLSVTMSSSLKSNPYTVVFLTDDPYKKVLKFYKEKLGMDFKELKYGGRMHTMTIYQFELEKGILTNQINKGVEIIPFNPRNRRVYKAKTKIKIIIPLREIEAQKKEKESKEE
jgi:hypothetical protein